MNLTTKRARAYVYSGDWVAECPRACGNVEYLYNRANPLDSASPFTTRKGSFLCSYCKYLGEIEWPAGADEIMDVLGLRPIPHTRNWYPQGHDLAIRAGIPHGQSVRDLIDENAEHGVE